MYWDKFKYFSIDDRLNHEEMWVGLNLQRKNQLKQLPMLDTHGRTFGYWLPSSFLEKLHFIDQYCGGQILVDEMSIHAGEKERYLINSIMEEAIASSLLEGAATTRRVAKEMLRSDRKPKDKAEKMVKNNYLTINYMKNIINEFIQKNQTPQLTKEFLKELQEMMTMDTLEDPDTAGRFRKANETIEFREEDGIVLHTPPSANDIEKLLDDLCDFANNKDDEFIHPVVKAIILHFGLAYIHPFVDGNGRTARALFYWYMIREGYWMVEFLSISRTILKAPRQYLRSFLYSEIDNQDLTYFIGYNLKAIMLAIMGCNDLFANCCAHVDLKSITEDEPDKFTQPVLVVNGKKVSAIDCRKGRQVKLLKELITPKYCAYGFRTSDLFATLSDSFRNSSPIRYELQKLLARDVVKKQKNKSFYRVTQ